MDQREAVARLQSAAQDVAAAAEALERGELQREEFERVLVTLNGVLAGYFGPRARARRGQGAKARILEYLTQHVGQDVRGDELRAVSGIQEWARRVRELRVEEGYEIVEVADGVYRLSSATPDRVRANQWRVANSIRRRGGAAIDRVGAFVEANVGDVVTREQIDYVAKIAEGSRRVRELRDERGWPIDSYIDDPTLQPGQYRLLSADPSDRRDPAQRLYPEAVRHEVFERDNYTCQLCGLDRARALQAGDTRFYLEVHHKVAVADELPAMPAAERHRLDNLVTLCHRDHLEETRKLHERKRRRRAGGS